VIVYFVLSDRNGLIRPVPKNAVWAEVGVYKGDFSQIVLDTCAPSRYYLIDNWKFDPDEHNPFRDSTENFSNFAGRVHWEHYGDDPNGHQEQNYQAVVKRFSNDPCVRVVRARSVEGIDSLPDSHLDVIYIDANHQYEYVLRDMMHARKKLKSGGIMLMDDFYEGPGGHEQNEGVMSAVNTFVKRHEYVYLAMSCGPFGNVALTDEPSSPFVRQYLENLKDSEFQFIGISDVLVPNLRYKLYRKQNGDLRYVAML
jgi:Methyltransferase domain